MNAFASADFVLPFYGVSWPVGGCDVTSHGRVGSVQEFKSNACHPHVEAGSIPPQHSFQQEVQLPSPAQGTSSLAVGLATRALGYRCSGSDRCGAGRRRCRWSRGRRRRSGRRVRRGRCRVADATKGKERIRSLDRRGINLLTLS